MDKTITINTENINHDNTKEILKKIIFDLEEKGYNAYKQITEYLITGEIGYISSYKECRNKITKLSRRDVTEIMLREFTEWELSEWIMVVKH